jgi:hypothetical protein
MNIPTKTIVNIFTANYLLLYTSELKNRYFYVTDCTIHKSQGSAKLKKTICLGRFSLNNLSFLVYLLEIQGIFLDEFRIFFEKRVHPLFEKKNAKITRKKSELLERN